MRFFLLGSLFFSSFSAYAIKFDHLGCGIRISPTQVMAFDLKTQPTFKDQIRVQQGEKTVEYSGRTYKFQADLFLTAENRVQDLRLTIAELNAAGEPIWRQYVSDITPGQQVGWLISYRFPNPASDEGKEEFHCRPYYAND